MSILVKVQGNFLMIFRSQDEAIWGSCLQMNYLQLLVPSLAAIELGEKSGLDLAHDGSYVPIKQ